MSETWKSTPPSGIQIKISERQSLFKTRDAICSLRKVEQNDIRCNVRLAHSCACPVPDNVDRIKESGKSE
jgi:transcriptional regulator of met regulon